MISSVIQIIPSGLDSTRQVASTGPTDKLSVMTDRRRLARPQPTAPKSPAGDTLDPCISWEIFPGYYPVDSHKAQRICPLP